MIVTEPQRVALALFGVPVIVNVRLTPAAIVNGLGCVVLKPFVAMIFVIVKSEEPMFVIVNILVTGVLIAFAPRFTEALFAKI